MNTGSLPLFRLGLLSLTAILFLSVTACDDDNPAATSNRIETLSGTVKGSGDAGLASAFVQAVNEDLSLIDSDSTDSDGNFLLENMPESLAKVKLQISHADYGSVQLNALQIINSSSKKDGSDIILMLDSLCCGVIEICAVTGDRDTALESVEVKLRENGSVLKTLTTDANGKVTFENVCDGDYDVLMQLDKYITIEKEFSLDSCDTLTLKYKMEPEDDDCCDNDVSVTVKDADGNILKDAKVWLRQEGKVLQEGNTNGDGKITFKEVCEGKYDVKVERDGFELTEVEFEVECDKESKVEVELEKEADKCCDNSVTIKVTDEDGNALENVGTVLRQLREVFGEGRTNADGSITFDEICEGEYGVRLVKEGFETQEFEIEVKCEDLVVERKLKAKEEECCDNTVTLKITDGDGNALEGVGGVLRWEGKVFGEGRSNSDGTITFDEVCEGKYEIRIAKEGFKVQEFIIEVECEDQTIERKMEAVEEECCDAILRMTITDKESGEAIKGAKVKIWRGREIVEDPRTNDDGKIAVDGLCKGAYFVTVEAEGYEGQEFEFEIDCEEELNIERELTAKDEECCDNNVKVVIKDKDGEAIGGVNGVLRWEGKVFGEARSNERGELFFEEICEGKYEIRIAKEGFEVQEFIIEVECDKDQTIERTMEAKEEECCDAILRMTITDKESGEAIKGAKVNIWRGRELVEDPRTNDDGKIVVDGLCKGDYGISVLAEGYEGIEFELTLDCGDDKTIERTLVAKEEECCDASLRVNVRDEEDESALANALVKLRREGKVVAEGRSNNDGVVEFDELCEGRYSMLVQREGYKAAEVLVEIECGEEHAVTTDLTSSECCDALLKHIVIDKDTEVKLEDATVKVYYSGDLVEELKTNADGEAIVDGLCAPRSYTIVISKDGYKTAEYSFRFVECDDLQETFRIEKD